MAAGMLKSLFTKDANLGFTVDDAKRVRTAGAHAVLVGEALMKAPDPKALINGFRA